MKLKFAILLLAMNCRGPDKPLLGGDQISASSTPEIKDGQKNVEKEEVKLGSASKIGIAQKNSSDSPETKADSLEDLSIKKSPTSTPQPSSINEVCRYFEKGSYIIPGLPGNKNLESPFQKYSGTYSNNGQVYSFDLHAYVDCDGNYYYSNKPSGAANSGHYKVIVSKANSSLCMVDVSVVVAVGSPYCYSGSP